MPLKRLTPEWHHREDGGSKWPGADIGQTALDLTSDEADKILIRWKEEYYSSIRWTFVGCIGIFFGPLISREGYGPKERFSRALPQVHFFVLSNASGNPPDYYEKFLNYWDLIRGHLQLDPESRDFKDVRENLAKHAVQCACKMSEDCKIGNGTVAKPCHFNIVDGKEQCSMMINAKVKSKPMHARRLEKPLLACTELTYRNLGCGRDICMKDCDKKGWSSWSACDIHGNKSRIRLDRTDSYSKFTESCPKTVTVPCVLTSTATSTTTTSNSFTLSRTRVFLP
uniref:Uncharacterized protein n=1 Tax=Romanomermis culicivorax TaxID=13658 RepID=A0A915IGL6_ROMCU